MCATTTACRCRGEKKRDEENCSSLTTHEKAELSFCCFFGFAFFFLVLFCVCVLSVTHEMLRRLCAPTACTKPTSRTPVWGTHVLVGLAVSHLFFFDRWYVQNSSFLYVWLGKEQNDSVQNALNSHISTSFCFVCTRLSRCLDRWRCQRGLRRLSAD